MAKHSSSKGGSERYVPRDSQARIVYRSPTHSDGYPVYERAKAVLDVFRAEGLELTCFTVTDNCGNVATSIVAPTADIAEQAGLRRFCERSQVSKGRRVTVDAEVNEDWFILHCRTAEDVSRYAERIRATIASSGREPLKRAMLKDLCEAAGLPFYGPDEVVMLRRGGGHLPVNWTVDIDALEGLDIAEKSAATIATLGELGMVQARNSLDAQTLGMKSRCSR